ncbi:hypothetical protein NQ314_018340 [Rhamnusium bicolor]|uniref:Cytochrome P450 n=1 Tax=Rhamnusium bicolor TaxID=1586634 RepID=A0AAV8WRH8_9CUCU|nr:hypothetical protein NQ314_018340 [Rhamnusium bicolor]
MYLIVCFVVMLFTDNLKYDLVGIIISILVVIVAYFKWSFGYWKRRGLETPTPSMPFGNTSDFFFLKQSFGEVWGNIYFKLKSKGLRHGGGYFTLSPMYIPIDLEIIKNILQRDFHHFEGHGLYSNENADPISANLFNIDGHKWRTTRVKLTPTFTSGKMKMMIQTLIECSNGLKELLDKLSNQNTPIDIKDVLARFTTDVIGSCAFGIDCNSMKDPDSEFLNETIAYREKNNIDRKDFMHLLIQLKNKGKLYKDEEINEKKEVDMTTGKLTINDIVAQSSIFFIAGFETSSTTMNFATYELAINPNIQDILREEINTVLKKYDDKLTYDAIMEMTYLDKLICETLRKYPPFPLLVRICTKDYQVPGTDVVIEKGTNVIFPLLGIHHDPEYYPNPQKFDPERFNEENKDKRPSFTWLPFGEGPRICIGLRFAMLQSKIGLITLLKHYKITLNNKTELPIAFKKFGVVSAPESEIWIDVHKIHN